MKKGSSLAASTFVIIIVAILIGAIIIGSIVKTKNKEKSFQIDKIALKNIISRCDSYTSNLKHGTYIESEDGLAIECSPCIGGNSRLDTDDDGLPDDCEEGEDAANDPKQKTCFRKLKTGQCCLDNVQYEGAIFKYQDKNYKFFCDYIQNAK